MDAMREDGAGPLGFDVTLTAPLPEAIDRVTAALKAEGFGVLTTIDVRQTLKEKINVDIAGYTILGACSPQLAYQALQADTNVGLLLPCNVIVYEQDGATTVSIVDPERMLSIADRSSGLDAVAQQAREKLMRVADSLR
ncbi:MAG TPA: DUF302 domain-containing protein [Thermomicrobiales bacterium]|nr:DUF302 domain-containing protein [Thermomicrobiales bacterium]